MKKHKIIKLNLFSMSLARWYSVPRNCFTQVQNATWVRPIGKISGTIGAWLRITDEET